MIKLGITGGIGSGKSVVSHILQLMDIPVYQTDNEAKRLMVQDPVIRQQLCALMGDEIYFPNHSLNRALLANYIFECPERLAQVNAIVHPRVKIDFLQWAEHYKTLPLVCMECAILYESKFESTVDSVLVVTAPLKLRIQRAMQRDSAQEEQIRKRIKHQLSEEQLTDKADFVVKNDNETPLLPQITRILHLLHIL